MPFPQGHDRRSYQAEISGIFARIVSRATVLSRGSNAEQWEAFAEGVEAAARLWEAEYALDSWTATDTVLGALDATLETSVLPPPGEGESLVHQWIRVLLSLAETPISRSAPVSWADIERVLPKKRLRDHARLWTLWLELHPNEDPREERFILLSATLDPLTFREIVEGSEISPKVRARLLESLPPIAPPIAPLAPPPSASVARPARVGDAGLLDRVVDLAESAADFSTAAADASTKVTKAARRGGKAAGAVSKAAIEILDGVSRGMDAVDDLATRATRAVSREPRDP